MAVYERNYRPYGGERTAPRWRFLVLPRYAFHDVFRSKLFTGFTALCFVLPLVLAFLIYLPHNSTFVKFVEATSGGTVTLRFQPHYYLYAFMIPMSFAAFFMSLIVGPALVAADLRNNALPLYLSRPFSRSEYILGKVSVLVLLLSAITWVPGCLLFALQSALEGLTWLGANWSTGVAIFFGSWVWILVLCAVSLALSAYLKWRPLARAAMFGLFLVLSAVSSIVNFMFGTEWGSLVNVSDMLGVVWRQLFQVESDVTGVPPAAAWISIAAFCSLCVLLLYRKVRAYEVVK